MAQLNNFCMGHYLSEVLPWQLKTLRVGRSGIRSNIQVNCCTNELESCRWPSTCCWLSSTYWFFGLDKLFLLQPLNDLPSFLSRSFNVFSDLFLSLFSFISKLSQTWQLFDFFWVLLSLRAWLPELERISDNRKAAESVLCNNSVFNLGSPGGQLA